MDRKANQPSLTLNEALKRASIFLEQNGHDGTLARYYWMMVFDYDLTQVVRELQHPLKQGDLEKFQSALVRLIEDEPIQYINGYADFMGQRFKVTPDTLIPREDTAGLIERALDYLKEHPQAKVLDIGTGTGIIPIMLAKQFKAANITACDISPAALAVAQANAKEHEVVVEFVESDLFGAIPTAQSFDLLVSNPPYIGEDELAVMDESVKKFEPRQALFAKEAGLEIYQRIAAEIEQYIQPHGVILLEIGYRQGVAVAAIFQKRFPEAEITVEQDLNGQDRYVVVAL